GGPWARGRRPPGGGEAARAGAPQRSRHGRAAPRGRGIRAGHPGRARARRADPGSDALMLVIHNARVATMAGPQNAAGETPLAILENGTVACDGDRITYLGRAASAPPGDRSIDAEGALLTPGL